MTSGEAAKILGVHRDTITSWDRKGILKAHHVAPNGYKYYTEKQVKNFLKDMKVYGGVQKLNQTETERRN